MTYTIHRGANEIGGSCVEICSATTRIVIDIGIPLMNPDGSSFNATNIKTKSIQELLDEKILPSVPGLSIEADKKKAALLISHAHQDHYGLIDFVKKNVPVYLGKASHTLIELTAIFTGKDKVIEKPHYFESYKPFIIGDMEITPYLMDHAAFDAYAFLVRCEDKTLLYTGDFRAHGRKWKLFYKFLHIIPKKIDWLLMEGTSLSRKKQRFKTEEQLEIIFVKTFKETRGINLVYLSGQNIDRLVTIFRACKKSGKLFVIDFYIATVLSELAALNYGVPFPSPGFPGIRVFFPNLLRRKMEKLNRKDLIDRFEQYKISMKEIDDNASNIVMTVRTSMDYEIKSIKNLQGGKLIYSMWEGYKENSSTERFLDNMVKRGADITTIHTSGHADYYTLQKLVNNFEKVEIVPIHTTEGKNYKDYFPNAEIKQTNNGETAGNDSGLSLFDHILEIGKTHENTGIIDYCGNEQIFNNVSSNLEVVCKKLELNEIQAILLSDLFNLYDGYEINLKSISEFIGCKPINVIKYIDDLRVLEDKGLILINNLSTAEKFESKLSFDIELETLEALKKNKLPNTAEKNLSIDEFLTNIAKLYEDKIQGKSDYPRTVRNMNTLLKNNNHLDFVKTIKSYSLPDDAALMLLRFCHYFVDLDKDEMDMDNIKRFYNLADFRKIKYQLEAGMYILQQKNLIQYADNGNYEDTQAFSLTEKAKEELLSGLDEQLSKKTIHGITPSDKIIAKTLFYSDKNAKQINELTDLLRGKNFNSVQDRLSKEGMRTGFACLFSGAPGTGKTETVYQIARQTGRGIMQVDISNTKSKWFGESEKKIKKIFTQYRSAIKYSAITPILFFNEADAIIGKRQNLGEDKNGPGQTENAIQNIILSEIENLNGILIATTNLVKNMDKAFERRFLYKIEFEKPDLEIRKSIWRTLIPGLSKNEIDVLAGKFTFSGGQIENIARRRTVAEVLNNKPPSLERVIDFCNEEKAEAAESVKIGFKAN